MKATNRYQPYEERTIPSPRGPNSCPQISVMKAVLTTPRQSTKQLHLLSTSVNENEIQL